MIIKKFENDEEGLREWMDNRKTKITGSRLKDVVVLRGSGEKKAFYELIAERLAKPRPADEKVMERGHAIEVEAIELCEKELGETFIKDLVTWEREDNSSIALSPDAYSEDLTRAVEVKCLCSADQLKAIIENCYPEDYKYQVYQYFIVNDKLKTLHFVLYDPSLIEKLQYKRFEIKREDIKDEVERFKEYQIRKLEDIEKIVNKLSF